MTFTIPNQADSVQDPPDKYPQAEPDKVDFDILVQGLDGRGVVSGCAVTAKSPESTSVAVAAGSARYDGAVVTVAGGDVDLGAADTTHPRFDLVYVDSAGAAGSTSGTAQANPVFPDVPSNAIAVAAVYRAAGDDTIATADIVDKRVILRGHRVSKTMMFEYPDEDLAVGDFLSQSAIRTPAAGAHGTMNWITVYVRCVTVGTGTNTLLYRTSSTLTGARTTRATVELGTSREASAAVAAYTVTDGLYHWLECSAVGGTAPKKVTAQVNGYEEGY